MGQDHSVEARPPPTHEEVVHDLAGKFAEKCFTQLELYSLKDNFRTLADHEKDLRYLKEDTVTRFLEIPDVLGASPVLFQLVSHLAAFPFPRDAPAVLGLEQLVIALTLLLPDRCRRVLARAPADRTRLLFNGLAVYDRKMSQATMTPVASPTVARSSSAGEFAVDEPGEEDDEEDEKDELVLAAFETLDYVDAFRHGDAPPRTRGAMIPADNLCKLIMLLLLVAPLDPQEHLSQYSDRVAGDELDSLRRAAKCLLNAFLDVEKAPGLTYARFKRVLPACCPYMFDTGFDGLFSHFLFSRNVGFAEKRADEEREKGDKSPQPTTIPPALVQPLLFQMGVILDANLVSQLSFFIPGASLFRRLRLLYSGDDDGFSMGSFESKVFNWRAPTVLLVRGRRVGDTPEGAQESAFAASLPPRRLPHGGGGEEDEEDELLTFGAYVAQPWRHTHRECFGDADGVLFQLAPVHDVFRASALNRDYAAFVKQTGSSHGQHHGGVSFGCPPPSPSKVSSSSSACSSSLVALGSVSLFLDSCFEYGVFTHDQTARGGAYATSVARPRDFQERFAIESLEVWGCGGDEESKRQAERWAWEAREAEARRRINLGTGDVEADRALLEMAGLVGHNRSGGSMA